MIAPATTSTRRRATLAADPARPAEEKPFSAQIGEISGLAYLGTNALEIAQAKGMPHPRHFLWLLGGLDHFAMPGIMPGFLKQGIVADVAGVAASASLVHTAVSAVPGAMQQLRSNLGGATGAGATLKALVKAKPQVPGGAFDALGACYAIAVPAMAVSSIARSVEHLAKHGTTGLTSTKAGRGAVLDALSGVGFLVNVLMANTPLSTFAWVFGQAAQTLGDVNNKGWLGKD